MGDPALVNVDIANGEDNALEFRDFHLSDAPPMTASSSAKASQYKVGSTPQDWSESAALNQQVDDGSGARPTPANNHPFYSIEYYSHYFDIDTPQVLQRMRYALLPVKGTFFDSISPNADLYGPFWIATTVVFVLFVTGNLAKSVVAYENSEVFEPDFTQMSVAATVVYAYTFGIPLLLWLLLRYYRLSLSLLEIMCLYGYALTVFIPISVICVAPSEAIKWTFSMLAFAHSTFFLLVNLWPVLVSGDKKVAVAVGAGVVAFHLGLALTFKFVFFTFSPITIADGSSP